MDYNLFTQGLLDGAPYLARSTQRIGDDDTHYVDALAAAAITAWSRNTTSTNFGSITDDTTAMRAAADAACRWGYRAGVQAGHTVVAGYIAASALDAAEPARAGMSDRHRDVANRLHSARVPTTALRGYLTEAGARHVGTWRGGDIFHLSYPNNIIEVLIPRIGVRDYAHRIFDAATVIADAEDRSIAAVLTDLAIPPGRSPSSHGALRFLWQVYETASEVGSAPARVKDPGPANDGYTAALVDAADDTDVGRLVTATLAGHDRGMRHGHADGAWSASTVVVSQLRGGSPDSTNAVLIDGQTLVEWVRGVDSDARSAAYAARTGLHHNPAAVPHTASWAFPPLHTIAPGITPETNSRPSGQPPTRPTPHR
ncbi:MAG: hypothetical protein QOE61_4540 [Micromonosporaceae bacterium]|nr:hypothetical protein [Micromonosporaceae bacterium]